MRVLAATFLTLTAYFLVAALLFGDVFSPLAFATFWPHRLGVPYWNAVAAAAIATSALIFMHPIRLYVAPILRPPLFVAASLILSTLFVGLYADWKRREAVRSFGADHLLEHSFFRSIREAPREFQLYLHTAALKDCVPYAWNYREMAFYKLDLSAAINVLPQQWLAMCSIQRPTGREHPRQRMPLP